MANFAVSWRSLGSVLEPLEDPVSALTVQSAGGVWIEPSGLRVHGHFVAMWCHVGSVLLALNMTRSSFCVTWWSLCAFGVAFWCFFAYYSPHDVFWDMILDVPEEACS
jgi:hypothetical protein